jgi:flagellar biosynthesis/type III secretory pathway protein FliH
MAKPGRILLPNAAKGAVPISCAQEQPLGNQKYPSRVVPSSIIDAQKVAADLVKAAREEAASEFEKRSKELEVKAQERLQEVERACEQREAEVTLRECRERLRTEQIKQNEILELGVVLAERLLGEQLRLSQESIASLLMTVLEEARGAKTIVIGASAVDVPQLTAISDLIAEQLHASVEIGEDASLGPGDVLIESELGRLDARVKMRLKHLVECLKRSEDV